MNNLIKKEEGKILKFVKYEGSLFIFRAGISL